LAQAFELDILLPLNDPLTCQTTSKLSETLETHNTAKGISGTIRCCGPLTTLARPGVNHRLLVQIPQIIILLIIIIVLHRHTIEQK